jgi:hypothetical protein
VTRELGTGGSLLSQPCRSKRRKTLAGAMCVSSLALIAGLFAFPISAFAGQPQALQALLDTYQSPLSAAAIAEVQLRHPGFFIPGFLGVMECESGLGRTGGSFTYNNPGNIAPGSPTNPWQQLANGQWWCASEGRYYNTYPTMYAGTKAAALLIAQRFNHYLVNGQWLSFTHVYKGVPPFEAYSQHLASATQRFIQDMVKYGIHTKILKAKLLPVGGANRRATAK